MNCTRRLSVSLILLTLLAVTAAWNRPVAAHPSHDDPPHDTAGQLVTASRHAPAPDDGDEGDNDGDDDKKEEEEKWDVSKVPGPAKEVVIDTDEGTWMNLDVSPDGSEIAFDLLGDIYIMPIAGGEAKPLTSDVEWDMQPRFSPDGKRIAFTSDRDGADNIWIMNRDGSDPKQVTKEKFRLLNQPGWPPTGSCGCSSRAA